MYTKSLERYSYSASAHVNYIKIHAEMIEVFQIKDCSFYIQKIACAF